MAWTKVEKEIGTDTKVVKTEDQECREMSWLEFGEKAHIDIADWAWFDLLICAALWTKVEKESSDWEKVEK